MKKLLTASIVFLNIPANAAIHLNGGLHEITSLRYTATYGIGFNLSICNKKNIYYITTGISGTPPRGKPNSNATYIPKSLLFMKLNIGYNRIVQLKNKWVIKYGTEFGFLDAPTLNDYTLINNLRINTTFQPLSINPNFGLRYLIRKHLALDLSFYTSINIEIIGTYTYIGPTSNYSSTSKIHFFPYLQLGISIQ